MEPGRYYPSAGVACWSWSPGMGDCVAIAHLPETWSRTKTLTSFASVQTRLRGLTHLEARYTVPSNDSVAIELALSRTHAARPAPRSPCRWPLRARWQGPAAATRPTSLCLRSDGVSTGGQLYPMPRGVTAMLAGASFAAAGTRTGIALDHRIGPVRLNEPRVQITKALGRGIAVRLEGNRFRFYWKVGIYVFYPTGARQRAAIIETRSARYKARSGVRVGSSLRQLRRAIRVKCHRSGQSIQCYHGLDGPSRPGTSFLINGATKRITRIALAYGV